MFNLLRKGRALEVSGILLVAAQLCTAPAIATDLSNVPLPISNFAGPNIMFTIDDSGSMDFELLLGSTNDGAAWYYVNSASPSKQGFTGHDQNDNYPVAGVLNFNKVGQQNATWLKYAYLFPNG